MDMEPDLEALPRSNNKWGYLRVKVSTSGKFQPQLFTKTGEPQRGLGSFDTAEEAAKVRMMALMKRKRGDAVWDKPVLPRAERGTVRRGCPLFHPVLHVEPCSHVQYVSIGRRRSMRTSARSGPLRRRCKRRGKLTGAQ